MFWERRNPAISEHFYCKYWKATPPRSSFRSGVYAFSGVPDTPLSDKSFSQRGNRSIWAPRLEFLWEDGKGNRYRCPFSRFCICWYMLRHFSCCDYGKQVLLWSDAPKMEHIAWRVVVKASHIPLVSRYYCFSISICGFLQSILQQNLPDPAVSSDGLCHYQAMPCGWDTHFQKQFRSH